MISAASIKQGNIIKIGNDFHKVLQSKLHSGGGKMGSMVHAKLRNLTTGSISERRFSPEEKVEDLLVERIKMQFLYTKEDSYIFMNPQTYDQIPIAKSTIGQVVDFLKENDEIEIEFYEEKALAVHYPPAVEMKVSSTGERIKGQTDSTYKNATLENGMEILVPQFVVTGDVVRVDVESKKYMDRLHGKKSNK